MWILRCCEHVDVDMGPTQIDTSRYDDAEEGDVGYLRVLCTCCCFFFSLGRISPRLGGLGLCFANLVIAFVVHGELEPCRCTCAGRVT